MRSIIGPIQIFSDNFILTFKFNDKFAVLSIDAAETAICPIASFEGPEEDRSIVLQSVNVSGINYGRSPLLSSLKTTMASSIPSPVTS